MLEIVRYVKSREDAATSSFLTKHIDSLPKIAEYTKYIRLACMADMARPIIDWGCQCCHVTVMLEELGFQNVIPYAMSDDLKAVHDVMKCFFPDKFVIGSSPFMLPFASSSISALISSGVFEHVQEFGVIPEPMLAEIFRILEPGGLFIVWKLPNVSGVSEIKSDIIGTWSHEYRYTKTGFVRLAKSVGFSPLVQGSEGLLPLGISSLLRSIPPLYILDRFFLWLSVLAPFSTFANDHYFVFQKPSL